MFVGRTKELSFLNDLYDSDKFEFAVIYGRRRVGKTTLIKEFVKDKELVINFAAIEYDNQTNLRNLSFEIYKQLDGIESKSVFLDFQSAFEYVFEKSITQRIVLVLDEYPYMAREEQSLNSVLQRLIDKYQETSKLVLLISGSSMSFIEKEVLSYKAPLYGRRTGQIKLLPFTFKEASLMLDGYSSFDKFLLYGALGGTPLYLSLVNQKKTAFENIVRLFFNDNSIIFEEPMNILRQELKEPSTYNKIITAIANGASRQVEIATKAGLSSGACAVYLKNLIELGFVFKENPYLDESTKKSLYALKDNMFKFYYRFVPQYLNIMRVSSFESIPPFMANSISEYLGKAFEGLCKEYLWQEFYLGNSPLMFKSLGRWWGNDPRSKSQSEIDIVGEADKDNCLFAECKWTNETVDEKVLDTLVHRSELFNYQNKYYYLFSKSGFSSGCMEKAKEIGNVRLVDFEEMMLILAEHN